MDPAGSWYRNFEYTIEQERGLDFREDLYNPLVMTFELAESATVIASTEVHAISDLPRLRDGKISRRKAVLIQVDSDDAFVRALVRAADQFIASRGDG